MKYASCPCACALAATVATASIASFTECRAATSLDPLRLVSRVAPDAKRSATPAGQSFGMQLAPDGSWVLFLSDAGDITLKSHHTGQLDLYWHDRTTLKTELVSGNFTGTTAGDAHSGVGRATPDGRYIAFESDARNLVQGVDTNYSTDIFLRDTTAGVTRLVSANRLGTGPGLGASVDPVLTPDGRYVAFTSTAEDLVDGDTNGLADIFLRDMSTDTTECITAGSATPVFVPGIVYGSAGPRISADGRWVAFSSTATNLGTVVTHLNGEVYLRDRLQGTTFSPSLQVENEWWLAEGLNVWRRRAFSPELSSDGRVLAFILDVTLGPPHGGQRLRSLWRFDTGFQQATLVTTNLSVSEFSENTLFDMTSDGNHFAYQTREADGRNDLELWDSQSGIATLATPSLDGQGGASGYCDMPELSADGRYLTFVSNAENLVTNSLRNISNVYVRDLVEGRTEVLTVNPSGIAVGGAEISFPGISDDGQWVLFDSSADDLVEDDLNLAYDVFLRQREADVTVLVSRADPAAQSNSGNRHSSLGTSPFSEDGRRLLFRSESSDLAAGVTPGLGQVYLHEVESGENVLISVSTEGDGGADGWCYDPGISGDGEWVAFTSAASNLTPGNTNRNSDVFLRDLQMKRTTLVSQAAGSTQGGNERSQSAVLSRDGNWIVFTSYATDLVLPALAPSSLQVFLHERQAGKTMRITAPNHSTSPPIIPRLAANGRYIAYQPLWWGDVWLYDHVNPPATELIPGPLSARMIGDLFSRDARYLVTWGFDGDVGRIILLRRELETGLTETHSIPVLTGAGIADIVLDYQARWMAFATTEPFVAADTNSASDIYLFDFHSANLTLVSLSPLTHAAGRGASRTPSISGDGRLVAFATEADDLFPNDTNETADVLVFDRFSHGLTVASMGANGHQANGRSGNPRLSSSGYRLAFTSIAKNLVEGDRDDLNDVFFTTLHPPEIPNEPVATPILEALRVDGQLLFRWMAAADRIYFVETADNLTHPIWTTAPGIVRIAGESAEYRTQSPGYYRLRASMAALF